MYDSHIHLVGTGLVQSILNLRSLKSPQDMLSISIPSTSYRGEWLIGFGWDEHHWSEPPHKNILDQRFPDIPVSLSRIDGHGCWVNSKALAMAGINANTPDPQGGRILRDNQGEPTGLLFDMAKMLIDFKMPQTSDSEIKDYLLAAQNYFLKNQFTHARDMTCTLQQWQVQLQLVQNSSWKLFSEHYFVSENRADLSRAIDDCQQAKKQENQWMRARGIKIFYDGSLGSESALLSQAYNNSSHHGTVAWTEDELTEAFTEIWQQGLDVAIHSIGDQAAENIVNVALKLKQKNICGLLNLEHAQVLKPQTIKKMRELNIICHLQPCHWLSDRAWLKDKLGDLYNYVFPWRELEKNQIPFFFGSDAPIELRSIEEQHQALLDAAEHGISLPEKNWLDYFTYPKETSY